MSVEDVSLRPATMADFKAVMAIDTNVYGGIDYLPALYSWLVNSPDAHPFVTILGDRVIGYACVYVHEGGPSAIGMTFRLLAEYRSTPISRRVHGLTALITSSLPGVTETLTLTVGSDKREERLKRFSDHYTTLDRWRAAFSMFEPRNLDNFISQEDPISGINIHSLSRKDIYNNMTDILELLSIGTGGKGHFFCHGPLWLPLPINEANVRFASMTSDIVATISDGCKLMSVSFVDFYQITGGCTGILFYSGPSTADCIYHIKHFLQVFQKHNAKSRFPRLATVVHVANSVDFGKVREFLKQWFGDSLDVPEYNTTAGADVMFERVPLKGR